MNNLTTTNNQIVNKDYEKALALHQRIMANGQIAAQALVEFSLELKQMRDANMYKPLGFDSFESYVETAVGIKRRQAYNYIRVVERLGAKEMHSIANFGITKLALIAKVAAEEREEFLEAHPVEEMSTRELEDAIAELHQAREQLSFLEEENAMLKENAQKYEPMEGDEVLAAAEAARAAAEKAQEEAEARFKELQAEIVEREKNWQAELSNKISAKERKAEKEKAELKKEQAEKIAAAKEEGIRAGAEAVKQNLTALEVEKAKAIERAEELERQLKVSTNPIALAVNYYFQLISETLEKAHAEIGKLEDEDCLKYTTAFEKFLLAEANKLRSTKATKEM